MKTSIIVLAFSLLLGITTISEAFIPDLQRGGPTNQPVPFDQEKERQLELIKEEVRKKLEAVDPNLGFPVPHNQRDAIRKEAESLVQEAEMIREKIEVVAPIDSPVPRKQRDAIQEETEKLVREAEMIRGEIRPIDSDFLIPLDPNNHIQKRIERLAEETRAVRKETEAIDFNLDSPASHNQRDDIKRKIEKLTEETRAVRKETELAILKWEDLILSEREIMERHLSEWERAVQEYEEILTAEKGLSEYSKGRMRSLLREISVSEADIEKIVALGDPRIDGIIIDEIFRITEMRVEETFLLPDGTEDLRKLLIRGIGPPDTTIFLFIYSAPIIVSTTTDSEGNWTYLLEREMADGTHEIYVATVDQTGKILARSSPVPFVKEAAAIQVDFLPLPGGEFNALGFFDGRVIAILVIIFVLITATTIVLVGIAVGKRKKTDQ